MKITVRFAHLEVKPRFSPGDKITEGMRIARMGSTGDSTAAHIHMDNSRGKVTENWHLRDAKNGAITPDPWELNRFLNINLFKSSFRVTTQYADYLYQRDRKKLHLGYDVSTDKKWPWTIYWPIKEDGEVAAVITAAAYGFVLLVTYEVKEN